MYYVFKTDASTEYCISMGNTEEEARSTEEDYRLKDKTVSKILEAVGAYENFEDALKFIRR